MTEREITAACRRRIERHGPDALIHLRYPGDRSGRTTIRLTHKSGPKGTVLGYDGEDGTIAQFSAADVLEYLAGSQFPALAAR
jgi:hypothetical protein